MSRYVRSDVASPPPDSQLLIKVFLTICFAVTVAHLTLRELGPAYSSRVDELYRFTTFTSLETLLWPLLLQLALIEQDIRLKSAIVSLLLLIAILTPFRTASLSIFVFGFVLPLIISLGNAYRAAWNSTSLKAAASKAALASIAAIGFLWGATLDTQTRVLSASPQYELSKADAANSADANTANQSSANTNSANPNSAGANTANQSSANTNSANPNSATPNSADANTATPRVQIPERNLSAIGYRSVD